MSPSEPEPGKADAPEPGRAHAHEPERTCIGCRKTAKRSDLIRFANVNGRVVPDPAAVLPGRGAWLHPRRGCFDRAVERRAFQRALKTPVSIPDDTVDFTDTWQRSA